MLECSVMVKRKFDEICVEVSDIGEYDTRSVMIKVNEEGECTLVAECLLAAKLPTTLVSIPAEADEDEVIGQEISPTERFWQLLATAEYECWQASRQPAG